MPQKAVSMRKIREVLRLRYDLGLLQQEIARSCSISQTSVHRYLERATAVGLSWPLPEDCDDQRLNELLFPTTPTREGNPPPPRLALDFAEIHGQLQSSKYVTLQLLWEEYRQSQPEGYRYSRFCELYRRWRRNQDVVLRQDHRPGEKMFVDWAGATIPIYSRESSEVQAASLFVAALGASSYTFARASASQELPHWIECHIQAFQFFKGTTKLVVPDNPRTGVTRACRYEPDLNRTYLELAQHYHVAIMPARPYKARDKAVVEAAVLLAERWLVAVLRHEKFFSLAELNQSIAHHLERLNQRPFRKREGTRASLYTTLDRPALQPLPGERYVLADWKTVRVNIDYHVEVDFHYYSVPYQLAGQQLETRSTSTTVEIFHRGKRVASHLRSFARYRHSTVSEHMPKRHQAHLEWTPSRLIAWGQSVGEATGQLIGNILATKPHPEIGYRACLGIMSLAKLFSPTRLEAACRRALQVQAYSYRNVKSILEQGLDREPSPRAEAERSSPEHENLRGSNYYDAPSKPVPPTSV
jgi:transposase